MTCPECGQEIPIGGWPFCRDGHEPANVGVRGDDWPGGKTFENLGPAPVTVYSRSALRRELQARGLEECVRHVPVPGTDSSPHTTSWTAVNLDAGKALVERQATARRHRYDDEHRPDPETIATIKQVYEEFRAGRIPSEPR